MVTECTERIDLFAHMSLAGLCTHDHSLLLVNIHGNMKDVFSSIEKNLYTRRSLDMELKATIASSRLVFYILLLLPICLGILLSITSPNYLQIFFTSSMGIFLFVIGISIYIIYIIIIYHIMKIEKY